MTDPASAEWHPAPGAFRIASASVVLGSGEPLWGAAVEDLLHWRVKARAGFRVPDARVRAGEQVVVRAVGGLVREPVEVVSVVERPDRVAFAYRTLPGHPVDGEEAFILSRDGGRIRFTVRSLTRPASRKPWRALFPMLLLAQRLVRRRYLRALRP